LSLRGEPTSGTLACVPAVTRRPPLVELIELALRLLARGIGDTYLPSAYTHAPYFPEGLRNVPLSPALYDTFAIVTRPAARLSPGVRELLADLEAHTRVVADEFDRLR
jgi:hypothetical protein